jgi:hypothetical protein
MTGHRGWSVLALVLIMGLGHPVAVVTATDSGSQGSNLYTNARFGFSVRYPTDWRLGNPLPDGVGIVLHPPPEGSQVTLSGFMNLIQGTSQDGRQTLQEFAAAHRRIITELYDKKHQVIAWRENLDMTLAGYPAKRLAFTYQNDGGQTIEEIHIFSLGRNEGRGVRIKVPAAAQKALIPTVNRMLETFDPGRDQNAVSPLVPKEKG